MLPYIMIFGKKLPMYGLMMMIGATLAILFACLRAPKKGVQKIDVFLASIFAFMGGLIGAKLLFIITDIPNMIEYFAQSGFSMSWLLQRIAHAGIVFYGGLIGGFLGGYAYTRIFDLDFWAHADAMIPLLPLAHGFGRVGCFCAGCCYGREMEPPFGIEFTNAIGAPNGVPLFPVQLFEAGFHILILLPILLLYSRKKRKPGQIVGLYLICYGIFRFINEYLRADEIRGLWLGISTSQWISMALVPIGLLLMSGVISKYLAPRKVRCARPRTAPSANTSTNAEE